MAKGKSRLGRGLSSLLSVDDTVDQEPRGAPPLQPEPVTGPSEGEEAFEEAGDGTLFHVELSRVRANPHQPRRHFESGALARLAESLKASGMIQPIVVRQSAGDFELVAGERRLRAARLAGLVTIPALVRRVEPLEQAELALAENLHRENLNPIERALAYKALMAQSGATQEQIASRLGEDRSTVANHVRLLDLCEPVRHRIAEGAISLGHAKLLAGVHDLLEQQRLADQTVEQQLSVRALEAMVQRGKKATPPPRSQTAHIADLEKKLSLDLQMRVQVRAGSKKGGGKVIIHYASLNQFDDLLQRLNLDPE